MNLLVLVGGGVASAIIGRYLGIRPVISLVIYAWHTAFGLYYSNYVLVTGGDAFVYYQRARFDYVDPKPGTDFIVWITSFPVSLGFGYWPITLLYNLAGALGVLFFYRAIVETNVFASKSAFARILAILCVFIPSLSFWTSGLGKDALAFLSVGLFIWSTMKFESRQSAAIAAILIMLPVRPHIAVIMVVAIAIGTVLNSELRKTVRFGVAALATVGAVFAVPFALTYSRTSRFESIAAYIGDRQEQNTGGGSSIDITGMNPVARFLGYVYRPLPNEASGFQQLAASADNLLLVAFTLVGIVGIYRAGTLLMFRRYSIGILYALGCLGLLSQVTANLGLAVRQKWMALPALLLVVVAAWAAKKDRSAINRNNWRPSGAPQAVR